MSGLVVWMAAVGVFGAGVSLPTQFNVTPLTPSSTSPFVYSEASINSVGDVVYLEKQVGLRTIKTDGTGDRSLDIPWVVSNPAINGNGQFLSARGSSGDNLWLSTLATSPAGTNLASNPLYTGSKSSFLPDLNDNGQIVFNNGGNTLWLTDTAGTFFTNLSAITGMSPDGSSRVSINNAGKIVFSSGGDIYLTDTAGHTPVNLTASISLNLRNPDINNNGVICARDEATANRGIYLLDIFGSTPVKVTNRATDGEAAPAQINDSNQLVIPIDPPPPNTSDFRVFLYTPVPEPATCLLVILGAGAMARRRWA